MNALDRAISAAGGVSVLAKLLGITQSAVSNWRIRGLVSVRHCLAIEQATKGAVTRYELRPDVFGPAPTTQEAGRAA